MTNILDPIIQLIKNLPLEQRQALYSHLKSIQIEDENELSSIVTICESENCHQRCPNCQSSKFKKNGRYKDRQRYKCKTCDRTFNEFTGTVWHYIHDKGKFQQYFQCLAEQKTLLECTLNLNICMQTAFCWRHKILVAFEKADLKPLRKLIQADETNILESCKGNPKDVAENQRAARKRGSKAKNGGFSDDNLCILVACDEDKNAILRHVGNGRLTKSMVFNALNPVIRRQRVHQAVFVTDRSSSFPAFAKEKKLIHQTVISKYKQYVNTQGFHIQLVNAIHSRLKKWLSKFNGVATKYMQNYLNFFRLWDKFTSFKERFIYFFRMSFFDKNAFIRCQDIGSK